MDMYLLHIDDSLVKLGIYRKGKDTIFAVSDKLGDLYLDTGIDTQKVTETFHQLTSQTNTQKLKLPLIVVLEPKNVETFLLVSNKENSTSTSFLETQAKQKLNKKSLDEMYYSFQRIAPFIYQFSGVKKEYLEGVLNLSNNLGLPIYGVVCWPLLLARTNPDVSSIFIYHKNQAFVTLFSNLSGTIELISHKEMPSESELKKLFKITSLYDSRESDPIIYNLPGNLGTELDLKHLKCAQVSIDTLQPGFEELELVRWGFTKLPSFSLSNANLLNLVPTPAVETKKPVAAYALGVLGLIVCGGLVFRQSIIARKNKDFITNQASVLSETTNKVEETAQTTQSQPKAQPVEIKRTDLIIQVLNGNGVAGSAAKVQVYMEGFGYKVANLDNADKSDVAKTQIRLKKEKEAYKELLVNDLKTNYEVEVGPDVPATEKYDVIVTVGLK